MSDLSQIRGLNEYLCRFGPTLGAKASKRLNPLHVPGKDDVFDFSDVVSFNPDREPFDPQKHIITACAKMLDEQGAGFLVGEMGCIAGESEVYDPVAGIYRRVDQITEPFHVVSWSNGKSRVGKAHVPFIKGKRALYRVHLSNGRSFVATNNHKMMVLVRSDRGLVEKWVFVYEVDGLLREFGRVLLPSIEEPSPQACPKDEPRSSRTRQGSLDRCSMGRRPCGGQPRLILGEFDNLSVHVTNVVYERTDIYYDFTVDEYHNYVMSGVVHHNTGKTLMAMLAVHKRNRGRAYRALVLCPDHLIDKWCREIEETIPAARVRQFKKWNDVVSLYDEKRSSVVGKNGMATWRKPIGPEWYVLGRNQVKWAPKKLGMVSPISGFGGAVAGGKSSRSIPLGHEFVREKDARERTRKPIFGKAYYCPKCGATASDKDGTPLSSEDIEKKMLFCEGLYLQEIEPEDQKQSHPMERIYYYKDAMMVTKKGEGFREGKEIKFPSRTVYMPVVGEDGKIARHEPILIPEKRFVVARCGEPLWQWTRQPYKWPPAKFIQRKLKGLFDDLVVDEVHEQKADDSAQADACGALIGSARRVLALTGTLIGGYADDLFALMIRMGFPSIKAEGFEWKKELPFAEAYGRVDQIVTTKFGGGAVQTFGTNRSASIKKETVKPNVRSKVAPGIMPPLFGSHMIGRAVFLTLEQLADNLPPLIEYVGNRRMEEPSDDEFNEMVRRANELSLLGPSDELKEIESKVSEAEYARLYSANFFGVSVDMDNEQRCEYDRIERTLENRVKELLCKGSMKLLSVFLHTCLGYPDRPYDWKHSPEVEFAMRVAKKDGLSFTPSMIGTVGYWDKPNSTSLKDWMGVVTPLSLDKEVVRPKEQALIDICTHHKKQGNQVWVYVQMTRKRNVIPRLKALLEKNGLRVGFLDPDKVGMREREAWIAAEGPGVDVMISHPQPVSTGLDLFDKAGGHNFNVMVFYQTGYSLFAMRQASRRSWRIGQTKPCFVYYLSYRGTMQDRAMKLMARKMSAAKAVDGDFSAEGLAGMAGEDNAQMSLCRALDESLESDIQSNWVKVKSGARNVVARMVAAKLKTTTVPGPAEVPVVSAQDEVIDADWGWAEEPGAIADAVAQAAVSGQLGNFGDLDGEITDEQVQEILRQAFQQGLIPEDLL